METVELWARGAGFPRFLQAHRPAGLAFRLRRGRGEAPGLAVVAPDWAGGPPRSSPCRALLLPGELALWAGEIPAGWVVSYGLAQRDSLTFSSLGRAPCLALQRELVTLDGTCREPQELPLPPLPGADPRTLLAWAGVMLLLGVPPEDLPKLL